MVQKATSRSFATVVVIDGVVGLFDDPLAAPEMSTGNELSTPV